MAEIYDPCIKICKDHPELHICMGCYRTKLQRRVWPIASDEDKLQILSMIKAKRELYGDIRPPQETDYGYD